MDLGITRSSWSLTHTHIHTYTHTNIKSGLMGLVFITQEEKEKKRKVSSSHVRATFLNMQLCYHRIHEEKVVVEVVWEGGGQRTE